MNIVHTVAPAEFGGLEEVLIRLSGGLRDRGHRVAVAAIFTGTPGPHPFLDALRRRGVGAFPIFVPPRTYLREIAELRGLLERLRPQVMHTHGYRPDVLHPGAARRVGVPTVTTLHGFIGGGIKNRVYEWLQVRSARSLDAVVAVSHPLAASVRKRGVPEGSLRVIPNAWEPRGGAETPASARAILGVPEGRFHIGWVGRVGREKGPDLFLDALAELPDLSLTVSVVGDGRWKAEMERKAGSLQGVDVRFHGLVPDAGRLFPAFDLFALSSRTEGTPMVLFEAMAASVPIVATAVGGVPDVLNHSTAVLVPPEDPHSLAQAIRAVHGTPDDANARARAAKRDLEARFSMDRWLARYEEVYRAVLRDGAVDPPHPKRP